MVEFKVAPSFSQNKFNAVIIPVSMLAEITQEIQVLKKIKKKDYPDDGEFVKWDLLEENLSVVLYNLDLTRGKSLSSVKSIFDTLHKAKAAKVAFLIDQQAQYSENLSRTIFDATFVYDDFMSVKKTKYLKEVTFIHKKPKDIEEHVDLGSMIGKSMAFCRELAEMPANACTPAYLAKKAQEIGKMSSKIDVTVFNKKEIQELKMNSFLSVAKGSALPPQFITLSYKGAKSGAPIVFVGKGITFDTGGHSLKPAASMMGMKFDMSGAATVLGLFHFLALSKLKISVIGLIPTCENIPGGDANKPDDIVTSMSGQTIEILNTDAEGRLILCDALTYAERFEPKHVIDIATLTGACLVALGTEASGLMANDQKLAQKLLTAGEHSFDRAWQLPLWDEYHDLLKSPVADMANVGGGNAGTITAGCFLEKFTRKYSWAHLDVAGTACVFQGHKRGSTGRPMPLLCKFLIDEAKASE